MPRALPAVLLVLLLALPASPLLAQDTKAAEEDADAPAEDEAADASEDGASSEAEADEEPADAEDADGEPGDEASEDEAPCEPISETKAMADALEEEALAKWWTAIIYRVGYGVGLIALGWIVFRLASAAIRRIERRMMALTEDMPVVEVRRRQHITTILDLLRNAAKYVVIVITAMLVLERSFGVDVVPIIAGAGIIGVAVAFGSQSLVKDVVTGILQLLEGQYAVGDYVQIGTAFGKVEDVGLRVTRLRDVQDKLYFIPNGTITMVTTYDDPSVDYVVQAPIADVAQVDAAEAALDAVSEDVRAEYEELIGEYHGTQVQVGNSGAVTIRFRLGIVPNQDWLVTTEVPARIKQAFADREIAMPEGRVPTVYLDISPLARIPAGGNDCSTT